MELFFQRPVIWIGMNSVWIEVISTYFPTKFSSTDDFPADWPPTTAIWGKSMPVVTPREVKQSWIRLIMGIRASIPRLPGGTDIFTVCFEHSVFTKFSQDQSINWLKSEFPFFTLNDFCSDLLPLFLSAATEQSAVQFSVEFSVAALCSWAVALHRKSHALDTTTSTENTK